MPSSASHNSNNIALCLQHLIQSSEGWFIHIYCEHCYDVTTERKSHHWKEILELKQGEKILYITAKERERERDRMEKIWRERRE